MKIQKRQELDELFHQPARLDIMAELCSSAEGRSFIDIREKCGLTDGNLSRHLQALAQAGAVKIKKAFVNSRPLTTVQVTSKGRSSFLKYLEALEEVLQHAAHKAKGGEAEERLPSGALKPVRS